MPAARHLERHFTSGETVREVVIGMSDGLTVPFALAVGLSGAVASAGIAVTAGADRTGVHRRGKRRRFSSRSARVRE